MDNMSGARAWVVDFSVVFVCHFCLKRQLFTTSYILYNKKNEQAQRHENIHFSRRAGGWKRLIVRPVQSILPIIGCYG